MVSWLLSQHKDANPVDDSKWTPLIIAASGGHTEVRDTSMKGIQYLFCE